MDIDPEILREHLTAKRQQIQRRYLELGHRASDRQVKEMEAEHAAIEAQLAELPVEESEATTSPTLEDVERDVVAAVDRAKLLIQATTNAMDKGLIQPGDEKFVGLEPVRKVSRDKTAEDDEGLVP